MGIENMWRYINMSIEKEYEQYKAKVDGLQTKFVSRITNILKANWKRQEAITGSIQVLKDEDEAIKQMNVRLKAITAEVSK